VLKHLALYNIFSADGDLSQLAAEHNTTIAAGTCLPLCSCACVLLYCSITNLSTPNASSAGGVDTSHQRWELDHEKALIPPDAIICTGLTLEEGAGRHFRQSAAQHQRILALLKAIGSGCDDSSDATMSSGMDASSSLENTGADAEDADESEFDRARKQLAAWREVLALSWQAYW
jgi:hypothetical protein